MFGSEDIFPNEGKERAEQFRQEKKIAKEERKQEKLAQKAEKLEKKAAQKAQKESEKAEKIAAKEEEKKKKEQAKLAKKNAKEKDSAKIVESKVAEDQATGLCIPVASAETEIYPEIDHVVTIDDITESEPENFTIRDFFVGILLGLLVVASGFVISYLVCRWNHVSYQMLYVWPIVVSVDVFLLSAVGYFTTEGKTEKVYGAFSIVAMACFVLELIFLF